MDVPEDGNTSVQIKAHQFHLVLSSPSYVWIEVGVTSPGNPATDVQLFVFGMDKDEKLRDVVAHTRHKIEQVL